MNDSASAVADGDPRRIAFESLYASQHRRLLLLARRILADHSAAEDAVHDAYLTAWRSWGSCRSDDARGAWIYGITLRTVLDQRRRSRRRASTRTRLAIWAEVEERARWVSDDAGNAIDLERAVSALPTRMRAVFVLRDIEGVSTEETGRLLGVATGTVKAHLFEARRRLARNLESEQRAPR